ncbi:hypothetical protein MYCTH_2307990 [Thermothelomyces thermophilus ATCC 42464]|uniref:Uncharacterized protein n=1 Tax=Thermothelomyces thermophilus (strain ATCC 42464 / BCRC 31852 / DSM 1799) TaxID=573729 RepID=G2QIU9_THET4|nr:uncharacterized protein MYCTH_2307990 [Thermothelomyces thermophilus ATCC 42464]AEO59577.1 hypothetical protein MYCTH_2307990 [Thermothelomyces thermophilus ATCC 42464]
MAPLFSWRQAIVAALFVTGQAAPLLQARQHVRKSDQTQTVDSAALQTLLQGLVAGIGAGAGAPPAVTVPDIKSTQGVLAPPVLPSRGHDNDGTSGISKRADTAESGESKLPEGLLEKINKDGITVKGVVDGTVNFVKPLITSQQSTDGTNDDNVDLADIVGLLTGNENSAEKVENGFEGRESSLDELFGEKEGDNESGNDEEGNDEIGNDEIGNDEEGDDEIGMSSSSKSKVKRKVVARAEEEEDPTLMEVLLKLLGVPNSEEESGAN